MTDDQMMKDLEWEWVWQKNGLDLVDVLVQGLPKSAMVDLDDCQKLVLDEGYQMWLLAEVIPLLAATLAARPVQVYNKALHLRSHPESIPYHREVIRKILEEASRGPSPSGEELQ